MIATHPLFVSLTPKVTVVESLLQQSLSNFRELLVGFEQLSIESETCKSELLSQRQKCESKSCVSARALGEVVAAKEKIIHLVSIALQKLNETKSIALPKEIFGILNGEYSDIPLNLLEETKASKDDLSLQFNIKDEFISPIKTKNVEQDVSIKDESVSEIGATPTGRKSPLLHTKMLKSMSSISSPCRDKKKCPSEWRTPETKSMKLTYTGTGLPVRGGRMKQGRISITVHKSTSIVDLTCSPEICEDKKVQKLIKSESSENDDTILPSPTSGPSNFFLPVSKEKLDKPKRPLALRQRSNNVTAPQSEMEKSINILQPRRFIKRSPKKIEESPKKIDDDVTHCENDDSMLLVQKNEPAKEPSSVIIHFCSPKKRPLAENINATNVDKDEPSISLLADHLPIAAPPVQNIKIKTPEKVEPVYKEPTARKKAEKMALPGWVCEECKNFFGTLYDNDPSLISRIKERCSKHRGRRDPARPSTPKGFWDPRWDVPTDTDDFNRLNDAI